MEINKKSAGTPRVKSAAYIAIVITMTCILLAFLRYAQAFFIPLILALIAACVLLPLVNWVENRTHIPRTICAGLILISLWLASIGMSALVYNQAQDVIAQLPTQISMIKKSLAKLNGKQSALTNLQKTAQALDSLSLNEQKRPRASTVTTQSLSDWFYESTANLGIAILQLLITSFLAFFLIISGPNMKHRLMAVVGTNLEKRLITRQMVDNAACQIQQSLIIVVTSNVLVGILTFVLLYAFNIQNALLWAILAALLRFIPYFGTLIITALITTFTLNQLHDLTLTLYIVGLFLALNTLIGVFLMTWWQSRLCRMNSIVIFTGVLLFGWLWGIWGLLLATPLLAMIKAVIDANPEWSALSLLLGDCGKTASGSSPRISKVLV